MAAHNLWSPLGFIQHAHTPIAIRDEVERVRERGETITPELVSAAIERAFRLGEANARRAAARARRIDAGATS